MPERRTAESRSCAAVTRALADIRRGAMVVLTDDEDRENEGDLVMAAEHCTAEAVNFMAREGRGLICLSLTEEHVRRLALPLMVSENSSPFQTAFTVSIEAARGVTTGISAADRARTIRAAIDPKAKPSDLVRPGHVFPLRARDGGVLVRPGQTEGSVDLARLAGLTPAGVICEVMNDDGTMARRPELVRFARRHRMTLLSVADLITYRLAHESLVRRVGELVLDREPFEGFRAYAYSTALDTATHLALVMGDVASGEPVLARVHRAAPLRDVLDAASGGGTLRQALDAIRAAGRGILVLLHPPLTPHEALALDGWATEPRRAAGSGPARLREIGLGAQILRELGAKRLELLTHTPKRIVGLERFGLEVVEQRLLGPEGARRAPVRRAGARRRAVAAAAVPL